jgi:hypothetical protein
MSYVYRATFTAELGNVLPSVGDMLQSVNTCMQGFGFDEKLVVRSELFSIDITLPSPITPEWQAMASGLLTAQAIKMFPTYNIKLDKFVLISS